MPLLYPKSCHSSPSHSEWKLKLRVASKAPSDQILLLLWFHLPPLSSDSLSSHWPLATGPGFEPGIFSPWLSTQLAPSPPLSLCSNSLDELSPFNSATFPPSVSAPHSPHPALLFLSFYVTYHCSTHSNIYPLSLFMVHWQSPSLEYKIHVILGLSCWMPGTVPGT